MHKVLLDRARVAVILLAMLMGVWFFVSFMAGLVITFAGCPKWLELPWSDFESFVETTDGRVYVDVGFYSRILCYDKDGNFIASYPYPIGNAKGTKLASGESGLLYFLGDNSVYAYDRDWKIVFAVKGDPAKERIWKLSENSKPFLVKQQQGTVPDEAVAPNELLFSPSQPRIRERFDCNDGSVLERTGDSILRVSKDGRILAKYTSPWEFFLLKFLSPSLLSIPLCILFLIIGAFLKRRVMGNHAT